MIELNLNYEQSKKILKLGYDFSEVCWKSWYRGKYADGEARQEHLHDTGKSIHTIEARIRSEIGMYGILQEVIPIIPKAAVKECIPTLIVDVKQKHIYQLNYSGKKEISLDLNSSNENLTISLAEGYKASHVPFCSVFGAFLWCHEKYPEKLREKFEEVLK